MTRAPTPNRPGARPGSFSSATRSLPCLGGSPTPRSSRRSLSPPVISDPPLELDLTLARQHIAALDALPRPTLISCRTGPRASAVAYLYAGLKAGATAADVVGAAEREAAPFCAFPAYTEWVQSSLEALRDTSSDAPEPK